MSSKYHIYYHSADKFLFLNLNIWFCNSSTTGFTMSVETKCDLYWADWDDHVIEHDQDSAMCNSDMINCVITSSSGDKLEATCDSTLQIPDSVDMTYNKYFCICGGKAVSVLETVNCADKCYNLTTPFPTCNHLELYPRTTVVLEGFCTAHRCDVSGVNCTSDGSCLYYCDNRKHDYPGSSSHGYVCNCVGPAAVPEGYGGNATGTACQTSSGAPVTASQTASTPGSQSTASQSPTHSAPSSGQRPICPLMRILLGVLFVIHFLIG